MTRRLFSARGADRYGTLDSGGKCGFVAIVGPGTAFTEYGVEKEGITRSMLNQLTEVAPDAILLVECDSPYYWIEPGDVTIEEILKSESETGLGDLKGNFPGCFAVAFVDGTVWFLKDSVPKSALAKFLTVESATRFNRDEVLRDYVIQELPPRE